LPLCYRCRRKHLENDTQACEGAPSQAELDEQHGSLPPKFGWIKAPEFAPAVVSLIHSARGT
jgi:hypothetical protein